ncbi:MAG: hypothetical protein ACYDGY_06505 [Acidimicrobiales bacterium]
MAQHEVPDMPSGHPTTDSRVDPAYGQGTYPGATQSYYVTVQNPTTLADLGCYETGYGVSGDLNVVLDFGAQYPNSGSSDGWGTMLISGVTTPDWSPSGAQSVVLDTEDFANGWRYCNNALAGWIGIGTNTTGPLQYVSATSGAIWGNLVQSVIPVYSGTQITIRGANDIEETYPWSPFSYVQQWIGGSSPAGRGGVGSQGYQGTGSNYFDYGSADGCSSSGSCNGGWTTSQVYDVAYGYEGAIATPEDYCSGDAQDWVAVEDTAGYIAFSGVTSDTSATCNGSPSFTPQQAWDHLTSATGQYNITATNIGDTPS